MCNAPPYERPREYTQALSAARVASRRERGTFPAIHDLITHANEHVAVKRLSKEVSKIVHGTHVRDLDHVFFHFLTDEKVPTLDMLHALVMLGIVCKVDGRLVVGRKGHGLIVVMEIELLEEALEVNGFIGCLGGSHDFGFARRQGDCLLLLATPRNGSPTESKHPAGSRMFRRTPGGEGGAGSRGGTSISTLKLPTNALRDQLLEV
jgi:hypothetical protein